MRAAKPDQVLGEERYGGGAGEDPPTVRAPPVAVLGARHAEDECHPVPGEKSARRPDEHVLAPGDDRDLENGTRPDGDEDLCDRETEVERDLPEHLQRHDHRREVQPRVADAREDDGIPQAAGREDSRNLLAVKRRRAHTGGPEQ